MNRGTGLVRGRSGAGSCLLTVKRGRKCQDTFKRSTTLDDASIDHHLSNSAAGAMSEDASTGLDGGTVGLEREMTE